MSRIFQNVEVPVDQELEEKIQWLMPQHGPYRILRQSVDARRSRSAHFVYTVEVAGPEETLQNPNFDLEPISAAGEKPLIIGTGPAGLFAALRFVERGVPCVLFERGSESTERIKGINQYWRYGQLDPRNNVCFGEGGAGLYSDGKLITRIKSPHIPYVMNRLVKFGAPEEIQWLSNPHVGSDRIRRVIPKMREFLKANGCEIHFNTQVTEILTQDKKITGLRTEHGQEFKSPFVILATGHSAEDMLMHLKDLGVTLEGKSFAMGLRVEHSQKAINRIQYREHSEHPKLGAANYKIAHHDPKTNIGVYSFCMCPGGYVLSSATSPDSLVVNGMSNYRRNSPYANAALVVSIDHDKNFGSDIFGGMKLSRELESKAFQSVRAAGGTRELPTQNLMDFMNGTQKENLLPGSSPSGAVKTALHDILPATMLEKLREGLEAFNVSMKGFLNNDAQVYGVESRTSCPLRITRDADNLESVSHAGLFPAGEGAGYAGGITSAACDGIRIAEKIMEKFESRSVSAKAGQPL
jgi:uncharacterized FAD-dependent dehydrogenase